MLLVLNIKVNIQLNILLFLNSYLIKQLRYQEILRKQIIYLLKSLYCTRILFLCNLCYCNF